jgi:hypothetical protein
MGILEALHPLMQPGLLKAEKAADSVAESVQAFAPIPFID